MDNLENKSHLDEGLAIAIIGMVARFPKARNIDEFWENLCAGKEMISFFTDDELKASGVSQDDLDNPNYVKVAPVLDDIEFFDASFFDYTPTEASIMDPQHRILLECTWQALEHAGYAEVVYEDSIGVFAGVKMNTYIANFLTNGKFMSVPQNRLQLMIGNAAFALSTRISYKLNLKGPSYMLQTACSTSLAAVHLACQSLLLDECRIALAGATAVEIPHKVGYYYQDGGPSSPDGHCRSFDARAQGSVFGSGVGVVVLKRLNDALADGDTIYAVIKGSAVNNDGSVKASYTAPSVEGQTKVILEALACSGVDVDSISYIEAHGTGTPLGDPAEIMALTSAFRAGTDRKAFCRIGSVKSNVGHLDAAAGMAGLIKTILALKYMVIPPTLHFEKANPQIDFENSPFYVNDRLSKWQVGPTPRRAGVSSFGFGGTNTHVILEEAPPVEPSGRSRSWQLLVLSAKTESALKAITSNLAVQLKQNRNFSLADVAFTLQVGRKDFDYRRMLVCKDSDDAATALETLNQERVFTACQQNREKPVAFMFPGRGSQYVNMTLGLYKEEATFREQVDLCSNFLKPHLGMDLRDLLYPGKEQLEKTEQQLVQTAIAQPAIFVIEYALAKLWMEWGVIPEAMIGHSIGEYLAACLAGVFSLQDALALVAARGKLIQQLTHGAMLAVALSEEKIQPLLSEKVSLAAVNGPSRCVVSGMTKAVESLQTQLTQKDVMWRRLDTSHAFHSSMMDLILEPFMELVRKISLSPPKIPYLSNVTGNWITDDEATDPNYWAKHLRQTVRFSEGLGQLLKEPDFVLLEVGPGQTLKTLAMQHPDKVAGQAILSSLSHSHSDQSDMASMLTTLGKLWLEGVKIGWPGLYRHQRRHRVPLPTYPFERQRYWVDAPKQQDSSKSGEQLLSLPAKKPDIADWFYIPVWKQSMLPPLTATGKLSAKKLCWLLFSDNCGIASQLKKRLEQENQDVITVMSGQQFSKLTDCSYTIRPQKREDYDDLFKSLCDSEKIPQKIVHLWQIIAPEQISSRVDFAEKCQSLGFYSLLSLVQAMAAQNISDALQISIVSNNMHEVVNEETSYPEKATALGICKVMPKEYPNITCCSIDIVLPQPDTAEENRLLNQLVVELTSTLSDSIVAYRGQHRWIQVYEKTRLNGDIKNETYLCNKDTYLITGGLGGIGLVIAEHLARTAQAKLVLVGRSAFPERDQWQQWLDSHDDSDEVSMKILKLQAMEKMGAVVIVASADVTHQEQMRTLLAGINEQYGTINGVIHAAGVAGGGVIQLKTPEMANAVMSPKVKGTLVLSDLLKNNRPDFIILFSSLSAILGEYGQVDYCAANAFLDAFARHNTYRNHKFTVSINWDMWQGIGMATQTNIPDTLKTLRERQLELAMFPSEGKDAFDRILSHNSMPQVVVSTHDIENRIEQSLFGLSDSVELETDGLSKVFRPRPNLPYPYVAPTNAVEQMIAEVMQKLLGVEQIGINDNYFDLGGDSLIAMSLVNKLQERIGEVVHVTALFDAPSVAELAAYFNEHYPQVTAKLSESGLEPIAVSSIEKIDVTKVNQFREMIPSLPPRQETVIEKNRSMVFILSAPRCGSTLLRVILAGHPQLFAPPELTLLMFNTLEERKAALSGPNSYAMEGTIRAIMQMNDCDAKQAQKLMQEYEERKIATEKFYQMILKRLGNRMLVDKTPYYSLDIETLKRSELYFENPLYIHLLRHPCAMVASYERARGALLQSHIFKGKLSFSERELAELIWLVSQQNIIQFLERVPTHRQCHIKFEDLIKQPKSTVESICQFLNLDFRLDMLQPYKEQKQRMTDGIHAVSRMVGDVKFHEHNGINPEVADRWKDYYKEDSLGDITWQIAESFGYQRLQKK